MHFPRFVFGRIWKVLLTTCDVLVIKILQNERSRKNKVFRLKFLKKTNVLDSTNFKGNLNKPNNSKKPFRSCSLSAHAHLLCLSLSLLPGLGVDVC